MDYNSDLAAGVGVVTYLISFAIGIFYLFCTWRIYTKAGKPGWASLIPIYNTLVMLEIIGRPWYWLLLMLVPVVNIVIGIMMVLDLAKVFGKDSGFAIGLLLLSFIFMPLLAFGDARYLGPIASGTPTTGQTL